jgi:hypothetical protein
MFGSIIDFERVVGGSKLDPSDMSRTLKEYYVGGLKLDPCNIVKCSLWFLLYEKIHFLS